mgnify:CR=1 FL=1
MSKPRNREPGLFQTALVCAAVNAAAAYILAIRTQVTDSGMLLNNVAFGAVIGIATAFILGWAIRRLHSIGYILGLAVLIGLLVATVWLASAGMFVVAATLGVLVPLYIMSAVITCLVIHPVHPDR